jgi:predicted thioesterase
MGVAAGQRASVSAVVADADTAISAGSGDVPVLATPRLLALAEAAAVAAIAPHLAPGMTSVGTSASLEHRRASPVGAEVVVEAELTEVDRPGCVQLHRRERTGPRGGQRGRAGRAEPPPGKRGRRRPGGGRGHGGRVLVDRAAFLARAAAPAVTVSSGGPLRCQGQMPVVERG